MAQCFGMLVVEAMIRKAGDDGEMSPFEALGTSLELPPEAEEAVDAALACFDVSAATFVKRLNDTIKHLSSLPWAVVLLDRQYRLAGHFCSIRGDRRRLTASDHTLPSGFTPGRDVPPLSFIIAMDKPALAEAAATGSPLLKSAWGMLSDKPERYHWLCISDPLPADWVAENEPKDEALFRSLQQ